MSSSFEANMLAQDANAAAQSRQELQAKLNGLGGLNGRKLSPEAKEKKLREACEGFESIFIQKMWQEMRNTVPKGGLLQGNEERFWQDMYDQELSKSMTRAGGIGLADMMFEQLSRNLVSASRGSVAQSGGSAFTPGAAPLINAPAEDFLEEKAPAQPQPAASIYDGEAPQMAEAVSEEAAPGSKTGELMGQAAVANLQIATALSAQAEMAAHNAAKAVEQAPKTKTVKAHSPDASSGLQLAYLAKRDAGDKLGANAVRPALHARRQKSRKDEAVAQSAAESGIASETHKADAAKPGSMEGLKAALEKAKSGEAGINGDSSQNLHNIVAAVQAQNAMSNAGQAPVQNMTQPAEAAESVEGAAHTTRIRYSTNIPQKGKSNSRAPKNSDVIRMLNVENAGVNSKAGQGLAAYHAAQEAAKTAASGPAAPSQDKAAENGPASAPISPLTAQSLQTGNEQGDSNFAIPPLKAKDLRG